MKKLKLPKNSIYLVAKAEDYEGYNVVAAFKTKKTAEQFIQECQDLIKSNNDLTLGNYSLDDYDVSHLKIIDSYVTDTEEFPYFDK